MSKKVTIAFVVSAVVAGVIGRPTLAAATAGYRQMYPTMLCVPLPGESGGSGTLSNNGQLASEVSWANGPLVLACPIIANGTPVEAGDAYVYGYSNGIGESGYNQSSVSAQLCQTYAGSGGTGYQCGPTNGDHTGHAVAGTFSFPVDTSSYGNGNFNWMAVQFGAPYNGSYNVLFGYEIDLSGS
jgi:hypothetical protein